MDDGVAADLATARVSHLCFNARAVVATVFIDRKWNTNFATPLRIETNFACDPLVIAGPVLGAGVLFGRVRPSKRGVVRLLIHDIAHAGVRDRLTEVVPSLHCCDCVVALHHEPARG